MEELVRLVFSASWEGEERENGRERRGRTGGERERERQGGREGERERERERKRERERGREREYYIVGHAKITYGINCYLSIRMKLCN